VLERFFWVSSGLNGDPLLFYFEKERQEYIQPVKFVKRDVMEKKFDCLVCGTMVVDVIVKPVPLEEPIGKGGLLHVGPLAVTTGGLVCNTGIAMQRLGLKVAAAGLVGPDVWGGFISSTLIREGVDTAGLLSLEATATSSTTVLIDASGERTFAHHVGSCADLKSKFIYDNVSLFSKSQYALIGYIGLLPGLESELCDVLREIRSTGCRVAIETAGDGGSFEHVASALPYIDCFVPSLSEAQSQTGKEDPQRIIQFYRSMGAKGLIGVKMGSAGTMLSPAQGELVQVPCISAPGPVVDTTGAGDSWLAGFLAGILRKQNVYQSALLGAATAACCVTRLGATDGLQDFDQIQKLIKDASV